MIHSAHHKSPHYLAFRNVPCLEFLKRLAELLLRVHHDGAVPRHGFFQRLSRDQEETDPVIAGLNHHFVAPIEKY